MQGAYCGGRGVPANWVVEPTFGFPFESTENPPVRFCTRSSTGRKFEAQNVGGPARGADLFRVKAVRTGAKAGGVNPVADLPAAGVVTKDNADQFTGEWPG